MRRRLLGSVLGLIAAVLVAFAVPLAVAVRGLLERRALDTLEAEVAQVAVVLDRQARTCGELELVLELIAGGGGVGSLSLFERDTGRGLLTSAGGEVRVGAELPRAIALDAPARAHRAEQLAVAMPLSTRVCDVGLVLHAVEPDAALERAVWGAWLAIAVVGVVVLVLAALAAGVLGTRLARPFEALAASARRLGDGDFSARAPRAGLPEADQIADALDTTADRLGRAVTRGSAFAADAAHQLRTPLTALRLHLDVLARSSGDPATVAAAGAEANRLEATVAELAALTTVETPEQPVDLGAFAGQRLAAWRALAAEVGRTVELDVRPAPTVRVRPAAVGQALQVLLDNAVAHGAGTITVTVTPTASDGTHPAVRVCVHDEGDGPPPAAAERPPGRDRGGGPLSVSGGRGLALARSLVEAEGGRLVVTSDDSGTHACLLLPGRRA